MCKPLEFNPIPYEINKNIVIVRRKTEISENLSFGGKRNIKTTQN